MDRLSFEPALQGWRALDDAVTQRVMESMVVLELKSTAQVPLWLVNLVRRFGLQRGSFSKYGTSIRAFYQAPDQSRVARRPGA